MFHKYHKNPSRPTGRTKRCKEIAGCMRRIRITNPGRYDEAFKAVFGRKPQTGKSYDVEKEQEVYEAMLALDEEELKLAQSKAKKERKLAEAKRMTEAGRPAAAQASRIAAMSADEDIKSARRKITDLEAKVSRGRYKKRPEVTRVRSPGSRGRVEDTWQTPEERRVAKRLAEDYKKYLSGEKVTKRSKAAPLGTIYAVEGGAFRARIDKSGSQFAWTLYDPSNVKIASGKSPTMSHASGAVNRAKDDWVKNRGISGSRNIEVDVMRTEMNGRKAYAWSVVDRSSGRELRGGIETSKRGAERAAEKFLTQMALQEGKRERKVQRAEVVSRGLAKKFKRAFKPPVGYEEIRKYKIPDDVAKDASEARGKGRRVKGKEVLNIVYRKGKDGWYARVMKPDGTMGDELGPYKDIIKAENRATFLAGYMGGAAMRVGAHLEGNPARIINSARRGMKKLMKGKRIKNPSLADSLGLGSASAPRGDVDESVIFSDDRLDALTPSLDEESAQIFYLGYFFGVRDGIDLAGVQNFAKRRRIRKKAERRLIDASNKFKQQVLLPGRESDGNRM